MAYSADDMLKKLMEQEHISAIAQDGNDENVKVITMSSKDAIMMAIVGVQVCLNLMRVKGLVTDKEVILMGAAVAELMGESYDHGDTSQDE